jgi:hypothetical protein
VRLRLSPAEPVLLQLRAPIPLVSVLGRPGAAVEVGVHAEGARLDAVLPAGASDLLLRPAQPGPLHGRLDLLASRVAPIGEGLGPELVLAPGSSRAFSFTVAEGGPVGVGVRASEETVEATLLDAGLRPVAAGLVQMPTLAPGVYVLVVRAPAEGRALSVRPAVAGLTQPSTDPPPEVVRRYLEPEEPRPGFSSRRVEAEPERVEEGAEGEEPAADEAGLEEDEIEDEPPPFEGRASGGGGW